VGGAVAVAAPESQDGWVTDGLCKVALAVTPGDCGYNGDRSKVRIEEQVVDMPAGEGGHG
jgi:hypothetical protein